MINKEEFEIIQKKAIDDLNDRNHNQLIKPNSNVTPEQTRKFLDELMILFNEMKSRIEKREQTDKDFTSSKPSDTTELTRK
jgi:hypothetical protein